MTKNHVLYDLAGSWVDDLGPGAEIDLGGLAWLEAEHDRGHDSGFGVLLQKALNRAIAAVEAKVPDQGQMDRRGLDVLISPGEPSRIRIKICLTSNISNLQLATCSLLI